MLTTAQIERLSDREFRADLNNHLEHEELNDLLAEKIFQRSSELYYDALHNDAAMQTLDDDYEVLRGYHSQFARVLKNLDGAINGDQISIDAIFTALTVVQKNLKIVCEEIASKELA